ncbi:MAG: hypothetical protein K0Q55_4048 [Verrucomicrobia bacterium]|jgi:hypothetical protein|nr:hypothetical protein [Verrucomicrobiota bacterium]
MSRSQNSISVLLVAAALLYSGAQAADAPPAVPVNTNAIQQLKAVKGRELILANCLPCHSTAVIASTHQTREKWDQTITKMQKQNGMWPIPTSIRTQILDYLEATQPPSDPGLDKGKVTPWATPLYRPNPLW